jgi:hypothetical protein
VPTLEPKYTGNERDERKWDVLPAQTVFALLEAARTDQAIERLTKAGIAEDDLEVLRGKDGVRRLEPSSTEAGGVEGFLSKVLHQITDETTLLESYGRGLEQGMALIAVRFDAENKKKANEKRSIIEAVLLDSGGAKMSYTSNWTLTEVVERKRPL